MILSIGMIVKNEAGNLRECLTGIKPILEQVESELIIADTGSRDGTMDVAKEFTPNVYEIEWRNDFAWARNTTLERARGEWYMFLDADEVFEDVETPLVPVYDPNHPDADEEGYIYMPNVDTTQEMMDAMAATRSYSANISSFEAIKSMARMALEIGRRAGFTVFFTTRPGANPPRSPTRSTANLSSRR